MKPRLRALFFPDGVAAAATTTSSASSRPPPPPSRQPPPSLAVASRPALTSPRAASRQHTSITAARPTTATCRARAAAGRRPRGPAVKPRGKSLRGRPSASWGLQRLGREQRPPRLPSPPTRRGGRSGKRRRGGQSRPPRSDRCRWTTANPPPCWRAMCRPKTEAVRVGRVAAWQKRAPARGETAIVQHLRVRREGEQKGNRNGVSGMKKRIGRGLTCELGKEQN